MFYVIGSENQSRVLLSTAPANRTKGVVEQFGTSGVPIPCRMDRPMVEHWYSVVPPLYRYITYPSSFWMSLTVFGISKSSFQRGRKKIPLLVRTFRSDLSTGFREDFEKLPHIPPEETFKFAPYLTYFLTRFFMVFCAAFWKQRISLS